MEKYALTVKKLNAYATNLFGKQTNQILKNVSFNVPEGKICVFIGHNGAGKTTTIKSILGLRLIQSGEITILGKDSKNILSRQSVGYIPEKGNIEKISAEYFLRSMSKFYDLSEQEVDKRVKEILKHFDLETDFLDRKMHCLSSGQNKIITIIQAFLANNKLIIADEPTDNLDPENRDMFWDFVHLYHKQYPETTFFIVTHNLDEVEKYTDYIVMIDHGVIKHTGPYNRSAGLRAKYKTMRDKWRVMPPPTKKTSNMKKNPKVD